MEDKKMPSYDYYRIFYYVATYKSYTKAAEMLNNNQPNITRCMNNLETELNCKLFVRSTRGITLTPEGERLYSHISAAYKQITMGEEEIKKMQSLNQGHITIASSESALHLVLLDILANFHKKYPDVHLRIVNSYTSNAIYQTENSLVDLAVITMPVKYPKTLKCVPLKTVKEILICGSQYMEYTLKPHKLSELVKLPFVSLDKETLTRSMHTQYFAHHGLVFSPDIEAGTVHQILPIVHKNLGVAFFPEAMAKLAIENKDVYEIRLSEPLPERKICILWNDKAPLSIAAEKLLSYIMESAKMSSIF